MLYRQHYLSGNGYVVYRHYDDLTCSLDAMVRTHQIATFICESEAAEYCQHRNEQMVRNDSDDVALIAHV